MNDNVEYLVREGLDRLTEGERAPHGLALRAAVNRRRRRATRAGLASVTAAVAAVAVVAATGASVNVDPTATDIYTVTGTDVNGCMNTAMVTVSVNVPGAGNRSIIQSPG